MAQDRVVKVSLTAQVSNYVAGMEQARKATENASKSSEDAKAKFDSQNQAMTQIGTGLIAMGALAAVGVALAVKKFAEFDQAMSNVAAATHESEQNMNALRDAALDAGAKTVFTATEAANAIEELGKAGLSTADILEGGLSGALDLASAGGLGVADAAGIAAVALKTFKLEGGDMAHVADILSAGAGKAMGSVTDLSQALSQSGQVASSTGLSIEETTATLSAFASQGLLGSDAGTSFKSMLQRLTPQSAEAAKKMSELGISAYDAQGNFIGMEKFAGNLQDSLKGLTTEQRNSALATIFGSDAVRAATVLYAEGEAGIGDWIGKVNDSGYAAETAALRMDNLKGDVEKLGGAFDTALIKSGAAADGVLRLLTQTLTNMVDGFNGAGPIVQGATLIIGGLTAAVGLGAGTFFLAIPKIAEYRTALETMGIGAQKASGAVAAVGKAAGGLAVLGVTIALVTAFDQALRNSGDSSEKLQNKLITAAEATEVVKSAFSGLDGTIGRDISLQTVSIKDFGKYLDKAKELTDQSAFGIGLLNPELVTARDGFSKMGEALASVASTNIPAAQDALRNIRDEYKLTDEQVLSLIHMMPAYEKALTDQASASGKAADDTTLLQLALSNVEPTALDAADAYLAAADEAKGLDDQLKNLIDRINEANGVGQDAVSANADYQQALLDANAAVAQAQAGVEGYGITLDLTTQAGIDNNNMLVDLAKKGQDAALAQFTLDGNTTAYVANLQANRDQVLKHAEDLGATDEQLKYISDHIVQMPSEKQVQLITNTQSEIDKITEYKSLFESLGFMTVNPTISPYIAKANGGILPGPPSSKDNMFIHAASGEFVVNARQTANPANRRALEFINAGGVINGYANGGVVRPQYASSFGTGGGNSYSTTGDTFNASFAVVPSPGVPLEEQVFNAARRLKSRQKIRRN